MRTVQSCLLILSAVTMLDGATAHAIDPEVASRRTAIRSDNSLPPLRLPRDPGTPVVTFAFADIRESAPPTVPELMIFADGRVIATAEPLSRRTVSAQLPAREWARIQRVLFVEHDLLNCESQRLQAELRLLRIQRDRPQPGADAALTVISIRGENLAQEIRCHAVGLMATQFPDYREIQDLFACQQCLQNIVHVARAGGYEEVHRTLQSVNTKLERHLPGCEPLSPGDLQLVDQQPDGTRYLQFSRNPCAGPAAGSFPVSDTFLLVSVYERPGAPPEISITGDPSPQ